MLHRHVPIAVVWQVGQLTGAPGHGAVALRSAPQHQLLAADIQPTGRILTLTIDIADPLWREIDPLIVCKCSPVRLHLRQYGSARTCAQFVAEPEVIILQGQLAPTGRREEIHRAIPADVLESGGRQQMQGARECRNNLQNRRQFVIHVDPGQHTNGVRLTEQGLNHGVGAMIRSPQHHHQPIGMGYQIRP
ncbi:hypothetical protein D3C72_906080 [compost metagenome]